MQLTSMMSSFCRIVRTYPCSGPNVLLTLDAKHLYQSLNILPWAEENHWQTFAQVYNPGFAHEIMVPTATLQAMVMDERKIIARRAAMESWNELAKKICLRKAQLGALEVTS